MNYALPFKLYNLISSTVVFINTYYIVKHS